MNLIPSSPLLTPIAARALHSVLSMLATGLNGYAIKLPLPRSGISLSANTAIDGDDLIITLRCSGLDPATVQGVHLGENANAPRAPV